MKTIIEYITELAKMSEFLKRKIDVNPQSIMEHLNHLAYTKSSVNQYMPDVQWLYDQKLAEVTTEILAKFEDKLQGNSSYIKNYIQGEMKDYRRASNFCDRVSSTIERQSENYRSILSQLKQELNTQ